MTDARDQDAQRLASRKENAITLKRRLTKAEAELARFSEKHALGGFGRTEQVASAVASLKEAIRANADKIVTVQSQLAASIAAVEQFEAANVDIR